MAKKPAKENSSQSAEQVLTAEDMYSFAELNPALEKMYAEMGVEGDGQANVYVTKLMQDGREAKIWNGQPTDYDLMTIARKFGSGDYRVKLYVQHESGRFVMKANTIIPVMLEAGEDARIEALRTGQSVSASGAPVVSAADIARAVAEAVKAVMPVPVAAGSNLGMLKEVAEIVRTLAPQPTTTITPQFNPFDMMKIMAEMLRDSRSDDPLDRGVNATSTDVFLRLIDKFAPMFTEVLSKNGAAVAALPAPSGHQPAQPATPAQPVQNPTEQEAMNGMKMGLAFLVTQAAADSDPATYAEVVLDSVPDEAITMFLQNPKPLEYLAQFDPRVMQYAQWFTDLIAAVKDAMKDESSETGTGAPVDAPGKTA